MDIWEGEHVRLRAPEPADGELLARWERDSDARRNGGMVRVPLGLPRWTAVATEQATKSADTDDVMLIIETLAGETAGRIDVMRSDPRNGVFDYGIGLERSYWGKGYAADALTILLRYYFGERRYEKVNGLVFAYNERSRRFHESFGFTLEGTIRHAWYTNGRHWDVLWYGLTAEEFHAKIG